MKRIILGVAVLLLSGCADLILEEHERKILDESSSQLASSNITSLTDAANIAERLSLAYFEAAISAQKTQDVASTALVLTAASVVTGSLQGVSDTVLSNRGIAAVSLQQAASRGVGKATIESVFDGAQVLNCVGTVARIYVYEPELHNPESLIAAQIVAAVIREVRINVRKGFTREVVNYSAMVTAFEAVIKDDAENKTLLRANELTPSQPEVEILEAFLKRLGGCVTAKRVTASAESEAG